MKLQNNGTIQTVKGLIDPDKLGYCQCHEHIFIEKGKSFEINPALHMADYSKSLSELKLYRAAGGSSIVDAQPIGSGRMAQYLYGASLESDVNIIASTGFHKLIFYNEEHWIYSKDENYLSSLFISEVEDGMYADGNRNTPSIKTDAKAGIIKVAADSFGIKGDYIKLFEAAAEASLQTGAPILCHIEKGADAFEVVCFLLNRNIRADSIIICHLDRARYDFSYHREIAATGVFLEYDTIARFKYHSNEKEMELIYNMLEYGYENQILLSLDTTRERLKSYGGTIGLDYIRNVFIKELTKYGVTNEITDKFMIENPKKALLINKSMKGVCK